MIIKQPNPPYRSVLTTQLNHLVSLAKWLCVGLRTKWLWVRVQLHSLKLEISRLLRARSSLTFRPLGFTLKRVCHMIITYSQMHQTDKYSWYSSIIWTVWLNGWVFVYELRGCGFESSWSHLIFAPASSKEFLDIQASEHSDQHFKNLWEIIVWRVI